MNAVAENVTSVRCGRDQGVPGPGSRGPYQAPYGLPEGQEVRLNPAIAPNYIPEIIGHLGEHISLWYSDAMLEAATAALRAQTKNPTITLESFMATGVEVPLDRLMAQLDDDVLELANEQMKDVPQIIYEARELMKELAPPTPMDPSAVAQEDVQRQRKADSMQHEGKVIELAEREAGAEIRRRPQGAAARDRCPPEGAGHGGETARVHGTRCAGRPAAGAERPNRPSRIVSRVRLSPTRTTIPSSKSPR